MVSQINKYEYTLDTNVIINLYENPNLGGLLLCRTDFGNTTIHVNTQTEMEATRLGHNVDDMLEQIEKSTGAKIIVGPITPSMRNDAKYLETVCPTLHPGDSDILAYVRATGTKLITCDRGLAEAALLSDTPVVNPDLLPCDKIARNTKSNYGEIIKKIIKKPAVIPTKTKSFILEPGKKLVWNTFE